MHRGSDVAISDIAGTLLMVGAVVLAGGALTALVSANLSQPSMPAASFALAPVLAGDTSLSLIMKHGSELPLPSFAITLRRDDGAETSIPRAAWSTPDALVLRGGDRLSFPLSPVAATSEKVQVRILLADGSGVLAELVARTGALPGGMGDATLVASMTPDALVADGTTSARLSVRVSHPNGSGAIARVVADLRNVSAKAGSANDTLLLNDLGQAGDEVGGDGNWSGLFRAPSLTEVATYTLTINATDLTGRLAGTTTVQVRITGNASLAVGGPGGSGSGGGAVSGGTCYGCVVVGGISSYEGTRLQVPSPGNITSFRLRNWTWDRLHPERLVDDAVVFRVVNNSEGWSAYFTFNYLDGAACITRAEFWNATRSTVYGPAGGKCLRLEKLDLDMMDPVASGQLVRVSGDLHPQAMYPRSGLKGDVTFIMAYMRDEDPTSQKELAAAIGIYSVDVVMT